MLSRAAIFVGRVLDSHGRPVEGALVTGRHERDEVRRKAQSEHDALGRPPGDPEFHLYSREALTNGSGEFELHLDPGWLHVLVWTRADQMQRFFKPEIVGKAGERTDGFVLQLAGLTNVELELVDASGAPAQVPTAGFGSKTRGYRWSSSLRENEIVAVEARAGDGTQGRGWSTSRDPDGIWRMQVNLDPEAIEELEVTAAGYETIAERSTSGFTALVHRRLVLRELPSVRVRLAPKDPSAKVLEAPGVLVSLHACMADPARRAARGRDCCGFGSMWRDSWNGAPLSLVLPVGRKGAFWVYAYAQDANEEYKTHEVAHFGPFEAGADEHDLVLDPADFVHVMPKDEVTRNPPEASAPGTEHSAIIRAHISDAKTGKGVPKVWVNLSEIAPAGRRSRSVQDFTDDNGDLVASSKPAGRWTMFAGKNGYKRAELGERETRAGETLDLGTILLEPYTVHRGRLLDEDGKPPARAWFCVVGTSGDLFAENGGGSTDENGAFKLLGDLPPKFNVQASAKRTQRFLLDLWPEDEIKELRFVPSRRVVVTIVGAEAEESELIPYVCPAPGEPTATCDHRIPVTEHHLELARGLALGSAPEGQRYAFLLAPGRYQIWGGNLLHELTWTEFEVAAGEGDIQLAVPTH